MLRHTLAAGFVSATTLLSSPAQAGLLDALRSLFGKSGSAAITSDSIRVVDGDTLAVGEARFRMKGIDAPERRQVCWPKSRPLPASSAEEERRRGETVPCGDLSRQQLERLIRATSHIRCDDQGKDRYGRTLATCVTTENVDLSRAMVRQGWALPAEARYGGRVYAKEAEAAASDRAGIHAWTFERPDEYRRRQRGSH